MSIPRVPVANRFWSKVDRRDEHECWPWLAAKDDKGYGRIGDYVGGTKRAVLAQRVAWQLHYGPIPAGMCVLHRCDNPPCVNPSHLFLGTNADNTADKVAKGRASHTGSPGEKNGQAVLSQAQVDDIRRRLAGREVTQTALAIEFGVWQTAISKIWLGRTWSPKGSGG